MKKQLITSHLLEQYKKKQGYSLAKHLRKINKLMEDTYAFAFTRSSVFSSMIEGSSIDLDNYIFNKDSKYQSKEMEQIDDLIKAYEYAKTHKLNKDNVLKVHQLASKNFNIDNGYKGKIRDKEVNIRLWYGKVIYKACSVDKLETELTKFFSDIDKLQKRENYTYNDAFYYAAYAHLVFVNIHSFADGNGRISRLIEKWILSEMLNDDNIWKIPSEINYWLKRENYHQNLNILGNNYDSLNYHKA